MKLSGKNFQPWADFSIDISQLTVLTGPSNKGKCLAKGTPVLMYDGTVKKVEDVRVGDLLMGPDSKPRRVLSLAHGFDEMYDIVPNKGELDTTWGCNSSHVLALTANTRSHSSFGTKIEIPVEDFVTRSKWFRHVARIYRVGVDFPHSTEVFEPYLVGYWLGDGNTDLRQLKVTTVDDEIIQYCQDKAKDYGVSIHSHKLGHHFSTHHKGSRQNFIQNKFKALGLVVDGEKRIPQPYLVSSRGDRLLLLAGLLDSDGGLEPSQFTFSSKFWNLAKQVAFLARSLGFRASITPKYNKTYRRTYFCVRIFGDLPEIPTIIKRKRAKVSSKKSALTVGFRVVPKGIGEYFGFEIDGDGLFLLGDFTVTHNSSLFRALRGILRNELDAAYIRDPKNEPLELTLEINGTKITASRNKRGKVKYVINDDEKNAYTSLDGNIPPVVKDLLCGEIAVGDFSFDPIFGVQNDPQFLLDKRAYKPADLNAILGAFGGTEKLEVGKKEAGSRVSDKNGEAKTIAGEIRGAEERKIKLTTLSDAAIPIENRLNDLELWIRRGEFRSVWVGEAITHRARLEPLETLQRALVLPDTTKAELLSHQAAHLTQAAESRVLSKWLGKVVKTIDECSNIGATLLATQRKQASTLLLLDLLASRRKFPDIGDTGPQFSALVGLYSSIKYIGHAVELRRSMKAQSAELTRIDSELAEAQEELKKGLCPKCGRAIEHICEA